MKTGRKREMITTYSNAGGDVEIGAFGVDGSFQSRLSSKQ